jgi:hypothetical protein
MSGISTAVAADGADQPSSQKLWRLRLSRAIAWETLRALLPLPLLLHSGAGGGAFAARFAAIRSRRERRAAPLAAVTINLRVRNLPGFNQTNVVRVTLVKMMGSGRLR